MKIGGFYANVERLSNYFMMFDRWTKYVHNSDNNLQECRGHLTEPALSGGVAAKVLRISPASFLYRKALNHTPMSQARKRGTLKVYARNGHRHYQILVNLHLPCLHLPCAISANNCTNYEQLSILANL